MAKLDSDNPDLMPVTDAVYGRRSGQGKDSDPRGHTVPFWQAIPQGTLDRLSKLGKETKRLAARRRGQHE